MLADFYLFPLLMPLFIIISLLWVNARFFFWLMLIFIFAGVLFAKDVGFTLKASQFFALLSLIGLFFQHFFRPSSFDFSIFKQYLPFIFLTLAILPSITLSGLSFGHTGYENSLRFLFNFIFLQLILLNLLVWLKTKKDLFFALICIFSGYLWVLFFGFYQQIAYYLGEYDPYQYLSVHATFVDFYGPFLRFAPGTFANEFGEITQSLAIALTSFIFFNKKALGKWNLFFLLSLFLTLFALFLNFTRISWLIYLAFLLVLFFSVNDLQKRKTLIIFAFIIILFFYLLNLKTDFILLFQVLSRFNELNSITEYSAGERLYSIGESWQAFIESPFIGNGWGLFSETHNVPVQLLAETGLLGFCAFYLLAFYLFRKFWKMWRQTNEPFLKTTSLVIINVFIGCLIFDLTNHGLYHFILWLTIGLGLATERVIQTENSLT